ncbi:UbiH/UbiF/VisC/COQ6 family ubiquinone biosynthesis hydroxylase [Aliikangiella sp. IMCC44359]|uniref:UbiH/UbiF/VisC/COQ6 family ubiquinone biosynthesis hydroxylase n=1 Tax=Aliikangiella sp. IMCC44359 TaxID=3459125 RepID=UPI00403B20C4
MQAKLDIIIVGGGMVGLAMAAALSGTNLKIGVVEKLNFDLLTSQNYLSSETPLAEEFDTRVSAISPANQVYLSHLDVWSKIPLSRIANYEQMHVWDGDGSGEITFDAAEMAKPYLGAIVENQALRAALFHRLSMANNVKFFVNQQIKHITTWQDRIDIELDNQSILSAQLLIGADGAQSAVCKQLAIGGSRVPYAQQAFVANVRTEKKHQNTAWQRFTQYGPVAFLPLPQPDLCSIVWSIDSAKAAQLSLLGRDEFAERLAVAFESKLGKVELLTEFQSFPLIKRHSSCYLAPRCALIGDAAHTIHPLAGQGVNLGFQDVARLSQQIHEQLSYGRDFGLIANLRAFERERKAQNYMMQNAMSGFKWLFGKQILPVTLLRNYTMSVFDRNLFIKKILMSHAMGI